MQTLTYGYLKPETGDKGTVFFPALDTDIQMLNDHSHNGADSARLTSTSVVAVVQAISSASWASQGDGTYRQTVTMTAGTGYDTHGIQFRNAADGHILHLTAEKVTATSYYVYINDNSIDLNAMYLG